MKNNDDPKFRVRPGRIRTNGDNVGPTKSFLTKAKALSRQHGKSATTLTSPSLSRPSNDRKTIARRQAGPRVKRGRGSAFVRSRLLAGGWRHSAPGMRRVVVKARYVENAGRTGKAAAHLRYIQRDGTSREGERGQLYSAREDQADEQAFLERGKGDRRQFRLIVSPEDATNLADLTSYTRELMAQVELDLGTSLDWVAVNHHNTGHPHVHVIVKGTDDRGENLVISGDYLANGIRERGSELATLELGPVTEIEHRRKLIAEIDHDRFTSIDRALIDVADCRFIDLRPSPHDLASQADRTLRLRRLSKLGQMGLATEHAPNVWELGEQMEATLRELGERGDIIRNMQKALRAEGRECDPLSLVIHDAAPPTQIIGRVIDRHLNDELGASLSLVIDGTDGRTHYVSGFDAARQESVRLGSIVEISSTKLGRPVDQTIAGMAENGVYRPSLHVEQARFHGKVPGGDEKGFVEAHVRRLEALRRVGIAERIDADTWRIPHDFAARAADYDAGRGRANLRLLSNFDLERQIASDGPTWLDRRLIGSHAAELSNHGFGSDVREAMIRRQERLIERGDAARQQDGTVRYRSNLIATLQEREIARVGAELAIEKQLRFRAVVDGETLTGTFSGTLQLSDGKFAIIERSHEFTLVPWRPVIDRQLGREVVGIVDRGSVSWQPGRQHGLNL